MFGNLCAISEISSLISNQSAFHLWSRIYIFVVNGYRIKNKALQDFFLSYSLIIPPPPPSYSAPDLKRTTFCVLQSGLERSMEEAVAEGDVGKAEEMSDRLATREVRRADKRSSGGGPSPLLWQIRLMDPWPFFCRKDREEQKKSKTGADNQPAVLQHFSHWVNGKPSP